MTIMPDGVPPKFRDVPSSLIRIYDCVHMEQMRGVSYPMVADRVKAIADNPLISRDYILVVDATGVGIAVIDMMRDMGLSPIGITYTSGREITMSEFGYNVPKRDLVVNLQLLYQTGRIRIAADLDLAPAFRDQLKGFTFDAHKEGPGSKYGAETEALHDDLVTSAAVALWYAEKVLPPYIELPSGGGNGDGKYNPAKAGLS